MTSNIALSYKLGSSLKRDREIKLSIESGKVTSIWGEQSKQNVQIRNIEVVMHNVTPK